MIWRSKPIGLALVGCGNIGRVHAQAMQRNKRCRLVSVFDPERERAEQIAREFSAKRVPADFKTILEDPEVEGVVLATPHHVHLEQTLQALDAGKHVRLSRPAGLAAYATSSGAVWCTNGTRAAAGHTTLREPAAGLSTATRFTKWMLCCI